MVKVCADGKFLETHEVEGGDTIEELWIALLMHDPFFADALGVIPDLET